MKFKTCVFHRMVSGFIYNLWGFDNIVGFREYTSTCQSCFSGQGGVSMLVCFKIKPSTADWQRSANGKFCNWPGFPALLQPPSVDKSSANRPSRARQGVVAVAIFGQSVFRCVGHWSPICLNFSTNHWESAP